MIIYEIQLIPKTYIQCLQLIKIERKLIYSLKCTIGRTSRVTFGIPSKRLNITIYPILGESLY